MKKLSKEEMKKVVGGYMMPPDDGPRRCKDRFTHCGENHEGNCEQNSKDKCVCNTGKASWLSEECVL